MCQSEGTQEVNKVKGHEIYEDIVIYMDIIIYKGL